MSAVLVRSSMLLAGWAVSIRSLASPLRDPACDSRQTRIVSSASVCNVSEYQCGTHIGYAIGIRNNNTILFLEFLPSNEGLESNDRSPNTWIYTHSRHCQFSGSGGCLIPIFGTDEGKCLPRSNVCSYGRTYRRDTLPHSISVTLVIRTPRKSKILTMVPRQHGMSLTWGNLATFHRFFHLITSFKFNSLSEGESSRT